MSQLTGWEAWELPLRLNINCVHLLDEQFLQFCRENPTLRLELSAKGTLLIMPPVGMKTAMRNSRLTCRLAEWSDNGDGVAFASCTMFTLPNEAKRCPDASWIRRERWETLSKEQQEGIGPFCPEFVVELRSPSDRLPVLQEKRQEYLDKGARLGWLIDPSEKKVHIYRPGQPVEVLDDPATVSGDPVLPGFLLPVRELW